MTTLRMDAVAYLQRAIDDVASETDVFNDGRNWHNQAIVVRDDDPYADADWHGSIRISERFAGVINRAFATAGKSRDTETLAQEREAFSAFMHEVCHLQSTSVESWPEQDGNYNDADRPAYAMLEEGITDRYTVNEFPEFARRTGLDRVCPGIDDDPPVPGYLHLMAPTDELLDRLGEASHTSPDTLLRRFNAVSVTHKWLIAADTLTDTDQRLTDLPQPTIDKIRIHVAATMMAEYGKLGTKVDLFDPEQITARREIAAAAVAAGEAKTDEFGQWAEQAMATGQESSTDRGPFANPAVDVLDGLATPGRDSGGRAGRAGRSQPRVRRPGRIDRALGD